MALQITAKQLSLGEQGDEVARLHQALKLLGRKVPASEAASRVLGAGTVAVIQALQVELDQPATGVVDQATVRGINVKLSGMRTEIRTVHGSVFDANGKPVTTGRVKVFKLSNIGEQEIGSKPLESDGSYSVPYELLPSGEIPSDSDGLADLRVAVMDGEKMLETFPSGASIVKSARPVEIIHFVLNGESNQSLSEFNLLTDKLKPFLGTRELAELKENDRCHEISSLAISSGLPVEQVAALAMAHQIQIKTTIPAAVFYGLFRQGMPLDVNALYATNPKARLSALQASVEQGIVPEKEGEKKLEDYLSNLVPDSVPNDLGELLSPILLDDVNSFVAEFLKDSQNPEAFWKRIAEDDRWKELAEELKFTVQRGALVNNHLPLFKKIHERQDINQPSDLARLTKDEWTAHVQGAGVPTETPGANADEKTQNYVREIVERVEAAFPTRVVAERLGQESVVGTFLKKHPFDITRTYADSFFKQNPQASGHLTGEERNQIRNIQRVHHLTKDAQTSLALVNQKRVTSANQIARMDPAIFAEKNKDILTPERAREVHEQARRATGVALALLGEHGSAMNQIGMHALPKLEMAAVTAESGIPNWETLFGAFDSRACKECNSAHGPAAYFVDLLQFLKERAATEALFVRRPDLGDIELSCENTNTVVPYIDLVNEILENIVAPPQPFTPFTLPASLENDLNQTTVSPALAAAFTPPLEIGATIETQQEGQRWRIWDRMFAFSVVKENGDLKVTARSRQTNGTTAERRATPQYRNNAAYTQLQESVYPWILPFDLNAEEAKVFLKHLGVARHDLIAALRPDRSDFHEDALTVTSERLNLTATERKIIVNLELTPARQLTDFWGGAGVAELQTVRTMLDRSGLTYAELESVLKTKFVNPEETLTISAKPGNPIATADTTKLQINNLTEDALHAIHRFVRLWRKLGWTIHDLDLALRAFTQDPQLTNHVLVRISHLLSISAGLRITVPQLLALWGVSDAVESPDEATRDAIVARALKISVQDLSIARELTGLDPFTAVKSEEALRFVEIVKAVRSSGFSFSELDYLRRHRANPASSFVPTETTLTQTLKDIRAALLAVREGADDEEKKFQIVDRVAAALSLPSDVTADVLVRVEHGSTRAVDVFRQLAAIADEKNVAPNNPALKSQYETLEKLLKIAGVTKTLKLSSGLVDWVFREHEWLAKAPDPVAPVTFSDWFSLIEFQQLRRQLAIEDAALEAIVNATRGVATATDTAVAREEFVATLVEWLGWRREDIETLTGKTNDASDTGLLQAAIPGAYHGAGLPLKLERAMSVLKRLGVSAQTATEWCGDELTSANAMAIRLAARARHDRDAWLKIVTPIQNVLRDKTREALVSYLTARPETWSSLTRADASDLFAHFLVDVEMSSCQLTSRIKQALGSVQLFAQRALLGLEPAVQTKDAKWSQWEWMKNFRVWEANRKVWLYPENWIEPELRDDKTPFFKELENELLQSDLDDVSAEQSLRRYLEKVDEVARLEIVGVYEDEDKTLYVFGRTYHAPHIYYYRRWVSATRSWMPWEKIDLDIEGDHLIPVVWNGKLMLIWPVFTEKAVETRVTVPAPGNNIDSAPRQWEIQLAWSSYQHGHWSGKNLSEPVTLAAYQGLENSVLFGPRVYPPFKNVGVEVVALMARNNGELPDPKPSNNGDDDGGNDGSTDTTTAPTSNATPRLVSKELFTFKAFASAEMLTVRCYLRRDYRSGTTPEPGDDQIACAFGEFRFFGCRKIITTAHPGLIHESNFPLAPKGTRFDRMWFTGNGSGLVLFDGKFPVYTKNPFASGTTVLSSVNLPASIAGVPKETVDNKLDIDVLDTIGQFRLLAPHQDLQYIAERPAFVMDARRTFMISSTGNSGKRNRGFSSWLDANVATTWTAGFFRQPQSVPAQNGDELKKGGASALTLLAPGARGRRVVKELAPVVMQPMSTPRSSLPTFWTTREYRFVNFYHPYLCEFEKALNRGGIAALLSLDMQSRSDARFLDYAPEARVLKEYPIDEVEFRSGGAYEVYNWELFFHIPLLIACRLKANQRFAEAQRWFHYIFDPTAASANGTPQSYWRTKPFFDRAKSGYEAESVRALEEMIAKGVPEELRVAIDTWRNNPFSPHAIARLRTTAYQKTVVMKYIDNLIEWGDQLFRRETIESLNEATQVYVLAAEILGRKPELIERDLNLAVRTFNTLDIEAGGLSNALEQIELLVTDIGDPNASEPATETPDPPSSTMLYFCVPENEQLLGYWSTVADRLFKLRNCMDIEGRIRQLPLFEPPIDPALLVRARAAGLSIGDVLGEINITLPNYRFSVMAQKANELVGEVRNLGAALLSALEKRDAEGLSLLRSGQEARLLEAVREVRVKQVAEVKANFEGLQATKQMVQARKDYYESRDFISGLETVALGLSVASQIPLQAKAASEALSVVVNLFPDAKAGAPTSVGITFGGSQRGASTGAFEDFKETLATILNISATMVNRMAEYNRRSDEWKHQANLASIELAQIDKQLTAAQIRLEVAEHELNNHDRQIDNAREVDQFLRSKFTNQDLYQHMIGRISGLYFQSYQLAYELAKRAERCMQHELGLKYGETSFIKFGYWDSLKKGLLAGEHLAYDLKRLEIAYLDRNTREYELTKHISIGSLAPEQLLTLKETGACEIDIPEWLFDLDTPGHFMRRLKMVSVTIPCVTGPYTTVHCKLRLEGNSYRWTTDTADGYDRKPSDGVNPPDDRFIDDRMVREAIVTSTGQNDAGLFEPSMRDERYLPFEGAGAISNWRLELPAEFKSLDYSTISDVILHLRYTARDGGDAFAVSATESAKTFVDGSVLFRLFSLRHEFPSEWHRFVTGNVKNITVDLAKTRFPFFVQGREIDIEEATAFQRAKVATEPKMGIGAGQGIPQLSDSSWVGAGPGLARGDSTGQGAPGPWTFVTDSDPKLVEDLFVMVAYSASRSD